MYSIKPLTQEKMELYNVYAEWLNDDLNFQDSSVGISWTSQLSEEFIKDFKESFENEVVYWDQETLITKDCGYYITIKLVTVADESYWTIAEIR